MVRNDILGGLKVAIARGSSLQDAMQSFYNAGYKKEEIEEAAKNLQNKPAPQTVSPQKNSFFPKNPFTPSPKTPIMSLKPTQPLPPRQETPETNSLPSKEEIAQVFLSKQSALKPTFSPPPAQQTNVKQNVSNYGEKPKRDAFTIILIAILIVLMGILAAVFLFREQLVTFLNGFLD